MLLFGHRKLKNWALDSYLRENKGEDPEKLNIKREEWN